MKIPPRILADFERVCSAKYKLPSEKILLGFMSREIAIFEREKEK